MLAFCCFKILAFTLFKIEEAGTKTPASSIFVYLIMKLDKNIYYNPAEVGQRIRKLRKEMGIRQWELADELHISREMLSRIENGRNSCAPDQLMYLCQRFDKRADYFYFGEEHENSSKTRLEMINEIKVMVQEARRERLCEIYRIVQILTKV